MPELPEIECIKRQLIKSKIVGLRILKIELLTEKLRHSPNITDSIVNQRIKEISRRSKCLIFLLENCSIVIGFGMTGILRLEKQYEALKHDHIKITLENHLVLTYNDARRFGYFKVVQDTASYFSSFGPEPWDHKFSVEYLKTKLQSSNSAIKTAIMNHKLVAGIGNIYASEILFRAAIKPHRISSSLSEKDYYNLKKSIALVLKEAIFYGGSTLQDYRHIDGAKGLFVNKLNVYNRKGQPCYICQDKILSSKIQQRSSFYCPTCQK